MRKEIEFQITNKLPLNIIFEFLKDKIGLKHSIKMTVKDLITTYVDKESYFKLHTNNVGLNNKSTSRGKIQDFNKTAIANFLNRSQNKNNSQPENNQNKQQYFQAETQRYLFTLYTELDNELSLENFESNLNYNMYLSDK